MIIPGAAAAPAEEVEEQPSFTILEDVPAGQEDRHFAAGAP